MHADITALFIRVALPDGGGNPPNLSVHVLFFFVAHI
jgi:hypothetical protein